MHLYHIATLHGEVCHIRFHKFDCTPLGDGSFGDKSVTDLAKNFSEASQQNPCLFEPPQVMFAFFDGVTQSLAGETPVKNFKHVYLCYKLHTQPCVQGPILITCTKLRIATIKKYREYS